MTEAERFMREQMQAQAKRPQPTENTVPTWQGYQTAESQVPEAPMEQRCVTMSEAWMQFWTQWTWTGRASRSEFWMLVLCFTILYLIVGILASKLSGIVLNGILGIFGILTFIPSFALSGRRLHDIGWPAGLSLLPTVCSIILWLLCLDSESMSETRAGVLIIFLVINIILGFACLIVACIPSQPKTNAYGPVPNLK